MREDLIFFRAWLPNLLSEAELIVEEQTLRRAWTTGSWRETSVISPMELIMQTLGPGFDDDWPDLPRYLKDHPALICALRNFREALSEMEACLAPEEPAPEALLASEQWERVKLTAKSLVAAASDAGFSSADFAPV